jgi:hypothetical protein
MVIPERGSASPASGGALVARANLFDIVPIADAKIDRDQRRWASGPYLWLLRDVMPIEPIKLSGKLGVFNPGRLRVIDLRKSCLPPTSATRRRR